MITIFITSDCGFCTRLKKRLKKEKIDFIEKNISDDTKAFRYLKSKTQVKYGVPYIELKQPNGQIMTAIGYDKALQLLNLIADIEEYTEERESILTCPECDHQQKELMPHSACIPIYHCMGCQQDILALNDDCCVFCSYADISCPLKDKRSSCNDGICSI